MTLARASVALLLVGLIACNSPVKDVIGRPTDDLGRARLLVLTDADLPSGWRSSAHSADPVADRENKRAAACAGVPSQAAVDTADVFGRDFIQGAQVIASEAIFVRTVADSSKTIAALKSKAALTCATSSVRPVLTEQLRKQGLSATVRSIRVTRRTLAVGSFATAFRVVANIITSGSTLTIQEDVVFLAKGRAQVRATFVDVGVAFPSALELALVKKLSAKLAVLP